MLLHWIARNQGHLSFITSWNFYRNLVKEEREGELALENPNIHLSQLYLWSWLLARPGNDLVIRRNDRFVKMKVKRRMFS